MSDNIQGNLKINAGSTLTHGGTVWGRSANARPSGDRLLNAPLRKKSE